jgi:hypothetical protein
LEKYCTLTTAKLWITLPHPICQLSLLLKYHFTGIAQVVPNPQKIFTKAGAKKQKKQPKILVYNQEGKTAMPCIPLTRCCLPLKTITIGW